MTGVDNRSSQNIVFTQEQIDRNIRIFQLTGIDITVLIVPVLVLIWMNADLSFDQMIMLQGIFVLAIFLFEVPSGSLADFWSCKGSTSLFHLIFGAGIFLYAIGNSFEMFAIAEFLAGVGITFKTGSDSALVYDSLLTKNSSPNGQFGRIVSNRMIIMFIGASVGALVGGILAESGLLRLPIFITAFGHLGLASITYFGYSEPPRRQAKSPRAAINTAVTSLLSKKELKLILVVFISAFVFAKIGFWASQHILVATYRIDPLGMGIFFSFLNVCAAVSSVFVKYKMTNLANFQTIFAILIIDGIYLLALIPVISVLGIVIVSMVGQISRGIRTPIIQSIMQDNLASDERATFNSLMSLIGSIMYFLLSGYIDLHNLNRVQSLELGTLGIAVLIFTFSLQYIPRFSTRILGTRS